LAKSAESCAIELTRGTRPEQQRSNRSHHLIIGVPHRTWAAPDLKSGGPPAHITFNSRHVRKRRGVDLKMTLSRVVATATLTAGLITTGLFAQVLPASAQFYSDEGGFERSYRSGRRNGFVMEPDAGYANRGYRRYDNWRDQYRNDDRADARRTRRGRDRWPSFYGNDRDDPRWLDREERDFRAWRDGRDYADDDYDNNEVRSGGPRPAIAAKAPPLINLRTPYKTGSIIIDQSARKLYFIVSATKAYRYPISVGREGFSWTGTENVSRIADWPDWYPPAEMRDRDPNLPVKMTGGVNNPLGVKAIYLGKTLYRIHGTNNPKSIGQTASSGCFRMMNQNVLHLASLVQIGAEVHVLKELPKTVAAAQ